MINSVNSYSSYYNNYTSNNENSKTKISNNNSNLVNDKTQAVSKTLGYGVDKDGYFTSDFNEAAALPKDYKIYAKDIEYYADSIGKGNSIKDGFFTTMDIAKTIGNTYKIFSQLIDDENYINFSKEQLENIPKWFQYDFKNLKVNKIYQSENEFMNIEKSKNDRFMVETSLSFENNNFKDDQNISKGDALMAFFKGMGKYGEGNYGLIEGDTTILGKIGGLDRNMSFDEIKDLNDFFEKHSINYTNNSEITRQVLLLPMKFTDIEEFKREWLKLEAKNNENLEKENNTNVEFKFNTKDYDQAQEKTKRKPIQGESQNKETYKDNNIRNELLKKLLENRFDTRKQLELLFEIKFNDDKAYNEFNQLFSQISLNNNNVDLRV